MVVGLHQIQRMFNTAKTTVCGCKLVDVVLRVDFHLIVVRFVHLRTSLRGHPNWGRILLRTV